MAVKELQDVPRKVKDLYNRGFAAFERKNYDYAIEMFTTAVELEPEFLQARKYLRVAEVKKQADKKSGLSSLKGLGGTMSVKSALKKDPAKALVESEKLLRIDPFNKSFVFLHADAAVAAGVPEAAIMTLDMAKDHMKTDTDLLQKLGELYLSVDNPVEAKDCFQRLVKLKPNDQKAIQDLKNAAAQATISAGKWESDSYRDTIKDKDEAERLEQESRSQKTSSDLDSLIADMRAKMEAQPDNVNFVKSLADLHVKNNDFEEALELYEKANEMSGGSDPAIEKALNRTTVAIYDYNIKVLLEEGDEAGAEEMRNERFEYLLSDAEDRTRRYPNDLQVKFEYGTLLYEKEEYNKAIEQFQKAQSNPQRRQEALYFLGLCFKEKKQFGIAAEQFEKAIKEIPVMNDTKKDVYYELGQVHEANGETDKAIEFYKAIYAVEIGYKDVADKIEQMQG